MENAAQLKSYHNFLNGISRHLAIIQTGKTFQDQWPIGAPVFNLYLGEDWVISSAKLLLDRPEDLLNIHSNFVAQFFYPLLEKNIVSKEFEQNEIRQAGYNLFSVLSQMRKDAACSDMKNQHLRAPSPRKYEMAEKDQDYTKTIGYLEAISEISSPIYRSPSFEFHGPYGRNCVREYFIDLNPIENKIFTMTVFEEIKRGFDVDFAGHIIVPESALRYAVLLNDEQIPSQKAVEFLSRTLKGIKGKIPENPITLCAETYANKLKKVGIKISIKKPAENILAKKMAMLGLSNILSVDEWNKIIWEKTLSHLK